MKVFIYMNTIKICLIIIFSIFIGGCQHLNFSFNTLKPKDNISQSAPKSPDSTTCDNTYKDITEDGDNIEHSDNTKPVIPESDTTPQNQNIVENDISDIANTKENNTEEQATRNILINNQNNIDHALQIYRVAQKMWEQGELDDALANLDKAYNTIFKLDSDLTPEIEQQKEDLRYMISKRILEIYASRHIVVNGKHNEIPITMNQDVKRQIQRYTHHERQFFMQSLERSSKFRPFIVSELKKAGLPEELSWLPLVESGFKIRAFSSARALGLWQFIPSTGYKFGLKRDYYIDERLDPKKATIAAISYLSELHKIFGDWTTVLAAYNCGESRVLRIIRKQRINYLDNFWDLYQQLPRETSRYVPRFLATLHIVNNLKKYNFVINKPSKPIKFQTFKINKQVRLSDIAKEINVDPEVLKSLNPELRFALLPPEDYELKIPVESAETFLAKLEIIKTSYKPPKRYAFHRVKRGETLSSIARRYRTSIRTISRLNHIGRSNIIVIGKRLKVPYSATSKITPRPRIARIHPIIIPPGEKTKYKVKSGDNLWIIARRYNTTTKKIMAASGINSTYLYINQILYIPSAQPIQLAKNRIQPAKDGMSNYWVKSGDSPFLIAKNHNMSLKRFLTLNCLTKGSKIYPGQKLLVE